MLIYTINGYAFQFFISTMKGATFRHFFHPLTHLSILLKNSPAVTAAPADSTQPLRKMNSRQMREAACSISS
jgi:hypothetical protein